MQKQLQNIVTNNVFLNNKIKTQKNNKTKNQS